MTEGFYGQHSGTGKWYAEIFHPEFGPITQWGDDAAEATRKVEQYVRLNWDPNATEYSWAPYETPIMAGRGSKLGATQSEHLNIDINDRSGFQAEWRGILLTIRPNPAHGIYGTLALHKGSQIKLLEFHGKHPEQVFPLEVHEDEMLAS